ncbi:MAG: magnesium/cobalt transporter CorA [Bacillota bacterium]|jgi:magnesium transporter
MKVSTIFKRASQKAGLSPGTLIPVGTRTDGKVKISLWEYNEDHYQEKVLETVKEYLPSKDPTTVTWINVEGLDDTATIETLGNRFSLHPLVLEDILHIGQRPKIEDYEDYVYLVFKMLQREGKAILIDQVSIILGPNYVLSFLEQESAVFDPVKERIRNAKGRLRKSGADYLAYALIDAIVDDYFGLVEQIGDHIESVEEELVARPLPNSVHGIHILKRQLMVLRNAVWPLREVVGGLQRGDSPLFKETTLIYLRDVYDHTIQIIDTTETYREMVSEMLDLYLSSLSNRLNEVIKVLTIISTIFIPLTFIVGVYGMNFRYMPELEWRWGYPVTWLVMIGIGVGMLGYFRKRRWI